jgi:hypothetical protein
MNAMKKMHFDEVCVQRKEDSKSTGNVHLKTHPDGFFTKASLQLIVVRCGVCRVVTLLLLCKQFCVESALPCRLTKQGREVHWLQGRRRFSAGCEIRPVDSPELAPPHG